MLLDFLMKHVNALASWVEHIHTHCAILLPHTSWTTVQTRVQSKNYWDTAMLQPHSDTRT
jgi:hypothetical protein